MLWDLLSEGLQCANFSSAADSGAVIDRGMLEMSLHEKMRKRKAKINRYKSTTSIFSGIISCPFLRFPISYDPCALHSFALARFS